MKTIENNTQCFHVNPFIDKEDVVFGISLKDGNQIEKGDLRALETGGWEKCTYTESIIIINEPIYVRPCKE